MTIIRAVCSRFPPVVVRLIFLVLFLSGSSPAVAHQISGIDTIITISGTSTLRDWSCTISPLMYMHDSGNIPEVLPQDFSGAIHAVAHVVVPVRDIVCENNTMTKHLRRALQWERHPEIRFEMHEAQVSGSIINIPGELTIAGVTRGVTLRALLANVQDEGVNISGSVVVDMRDYRVEPPVVSLLILKARVKPEITLHFSVTAPSWRNKN